MDVILTVDLIIDGNPYSIGQRVTVSELSGELMIHKKQAIEYNVSNLNTHSNTGGNRVSKHGKR